MLAIAGSLDPLDQSALRDRAIAGHFAHLALLRRNSGEGRGRALRDDVKRSEP